MAGRLTGLPGSNRQLRLGSDPGFQVPSSSKPGQGSEQRLILRLRQGCYKTSLEHPAGPESKEMLTEQTVRACQGDTTACLKEHPMAKARTI